jgi:importin-5
MRSFSLVLLRRLLFRPAPATNSNSNPTTPSISASFPRLTLYDHLLHQTLATLKRLLLFSLSHEVSPYIRRKTVDTVCDLSNQGMVRGRPWHALQAQAFSMIQSQGPNQDGSPALRESAFRVFSGCPNLVMDLQTDAVLKVLGRGLQDLYSIEVKLLYSPSISFHSSHSCVGSTRGFVGFSSLPFFG